MVSRRLAVLVLPLTLISLSVTLASRADDTVVYKHRSESGAVLYSDKPEGPGGSKTEKLPLPPITSIAAPEDDSSDQADDASDDESAATGYQQLVIVSPTAGQNLRSNNGDVTVGIGLNPPLQVGDVAMVLLDGTPRAQILAPDSSATLKEVNRGEHSVQVVVLDATQTPLIRSAVQPFFLHRFSALNAPP